jgi:hypothetical protein
MKGSALCRLAVATVLGATALMTVADAGPACRADAPDWPSPGSFWVLARTATGSFGAGSTSVTVHLLGERTWRGRQAIVLREGPLSTYFDRHYRLLGSDHAGTTVAVYEPFEPLFTWPLLVGREWTGEYYVRNVAGHPARLTRSTYRAEAFEEIRLPAGRFVAFRIRRDDATETIVRWWSPDLGLTIKTRRERTSLHLLGSGILTEELLSWTFNPGADP